MSITTLPVRTSASLDVSLLGSAWQKWQETSVLGSVACAFECDCKSQCVSFRFCLEKWLRKLSECWNYTSFYSRENPLWQFKGSSCCNMSLLKTSKFSVSSLLVTSIFCVIVYGLKLLSHKLILLSGALNFWVFTTTWKWSSNFGHLLLLWGKILTYL